MQNALEALPDCSGRDPDHRHQERQPVYEVNFHDFGANTDRPARSATGVDLLPVVPDDPTNLSIEITSGPAKNKARIITSGLADRARRLAGDARPPWLSPFDNDASTPTSHEHVHALLTNPNLLVDERSSTEPLWVYDADNPAPSTTRPTWPHSGADNPFAVGPLCYETSSAYDHTASVTGQPLDQFRIQGFGMGADRIIAEGTDGAALEPGGITFKDVEDLTITLGAGNDMFTVATTPPGTKVVLDTGAGNDVVYVDSISGHTAFDLGQGVDTLNVSHDAQTLASLYGLLTLSGDTPEAVVTNLAQRLAGAGHRRRRGERGAADRRPRDGRHVHAHGLRRDGELHDDRDRLERRRGDARRRRSTPPWASTGT